MVAFGPHFSPSHYVFQSVSISQIYSLQYPPPFDTVNLQCTNLWLGASSHVADALISDLECTVGSEQLTVEKMNVPEPPPKIVVFPLQLVQCLGALIQGGFPLVATVSELKGGLCLRFTLKPGQAVLSLLQRQHEFLLFLHSSALFGQSLP